MGIDIGKHAINVSGTAAGTRPVIRRTKPWHRAAPPPCYRLRGWRRWLMWWMFSPMLLAGLLLPFSADTGAAAAGAVLLLMSASVLAGWEWLLRRTTLELTMAGPRLRQWGYLLETPWSNVCGVLTEAGREGFILRQPLETRGARRLASAAALSGQYAGEQAAWIADRQFIPIDAFSWHWRHGVLADDVSTKAPHLAQAMAALHMPPATPPGASSGPGRRRLLLWLALAVLVLGSMLLAWKQPAALSRALGYADAAVSPLLALQLGLATWQCARQRRWGLSLPMLASTVLALGWCAVAWQRLS